MSKLKNYIFLKKLIYLRREALLTIYKSFVSAIVDYTNITFDKLINESLKSGIENIQRKACIATTIAIQGTFRKRLYRELVLESLSDKFWLTKCS